jgi:hypothetical protein
MKSESLFQIIANILNKMDIAGRSKEEAKTSPTAATTIYPRVKN